MQAFLNESNKELNCLRSYNYEGFAFVSSERKGPIATAVASAVKFRCQLKIIQAGNLNLIVFVLQSTGEIPREFAGHCSPPFCIAVV